VLAVLAGGLFGYAQERVLFRPLRRRRTGNVSLIVVTIGLGLFLRNFYLILFGGSPRPFDEFTIQRAWEIGPVTLRPKDVVIMIVSALVLAAVGLVLQRTRLGTATRAVADTRDLAEASGVDVNNVILAVWVGGAALAALGGVLTGVSDTIESDMGFTLLLLMFAAVVLGGLGTAYGAMVGGVLIGVASQVSTYWWSTRFRTGVALAVLIIVVLVRPQGILGRRERIG
jgi:neutral amino acid transport system permease protein